ncbi:MAG: type II secretion system-associated lipoprotein [Spirochaetes bacterium]|nr:type II secretion system-associated lipoprotein [Spirochaetota bacterium]
MTAIRNIVFLFLTVLLITSCGKFIRDEEAGLLKSYETREYKLKKDISREEIQLKKGDIVKLIVKTSDDSIKVYCYSAREEFLKVERIVILFMFQDDFKDELLDIGVFEAKLFETVEPYKK